jgi:hypothetical protein
LCKSAAVASGEMREFGLRSFSNQVHANPDRVPCHTPSISGYRAVIECEIRKGPRTDPCRKWQKEFLVTDFAPWRADDAFAATKTAEASWRISHLQVGKCVRFQATACSTTAPLPCFGETPGKKRPNLCLNVQADRHPGLRHNAPNDRAACVAFYEYCRPVVRFLRPQ